ncbi:MAG: CBS domain-containing protein, partial [Phycisphaerales bacterium JB037]
MRTVGELLRAKRASEDDAVRRDRVESAAPMETVLEAAKRMNELRIGALVVVEPASRGEEAGTVAGILTERDILTRVVAAGRDPARTRIADVMTSRVIACTPDSVLSEVRKVVREKRIRHVPVVEEQRLVGMV